MGSLKVYATVAGFLAVATSMTTARAADLLPPPPPLPAVEPLLEPVGGGWYLRGDIGVSRYDAGRVRSDSSPRATFYQNDFGSGSFAGGGVGYQFNNWFRADVTGEYRYSKAFKLNDKETFADGNNFTINGFERALGDYSSAVVLVNGYVDLGNWYGVTPYIGGGAGYAYHWMQGFDTVTYNYYPAFPNNNPGTNSGTLRDKTKGSFAWAAQAGFAYDVTANTKLELGYRYINLGSVETGIINCYCGRSGPGIKIKDLDAHEVKLGMRWALGGATAVAAYEPAPLMRKY